MRKLLIFIVFVTVYAVIPARAAPLQNGISVHTELGKEQFIAALFTTTLSENASDILIAQEEKQIQVRVLTDRLSSRRFKRMWIEGMAINASSTELEKQAPNMAAFSNMLRVNLIKGDIFAVDRGIDSVKVIVNGATLGEIDDPTFFDLLLRSWIGPVPLSSRFRDSLLVGGGIDPAMRDQFNATRPSDERINAVASAIVQREAQRAETQPAAPRPRVEVKTTIERPAVSAPSITAPPLVGLRPPPSAQTNNTASQEPEEETTSTTAAAPPKPAPVAPAPKPTPAVKETSAPATTDLAKIDQSVADESAVDSILSDEEEEEDVTAESLLAQQTYIKQLRIWLNKKLRYPDQSIQRNEQGLFRVSITINRDGSLRGFDVLEETEHSRLNKAARRAIDKASPYPEVPNEISGSDYSFTLPIVFQLIDG